MRSLSPTLASHLAGGVTTLAHCWRLTRRDGHIAGFTDHDRDLSFDGVTYRAASGLTPTDAESQLGLGVSGGEVSGALTDAAITESLIAAGAYDDAEVATFLVNWVASDQRLLLDVASIGEIRRADGHFIAELRSAAHRYDQPQGRLYQAACAADFGDARCGVSVAAHTVEATLAAGSTTLALIAPALAAKPVGWASGGFVKLTSGGNVGMRRMIRQHAAGGLLHLWEPLAAPPAPGDLCSVTAGCDKSFATCRQTFANGDNFRGFPHIPTPDFVLGYARQGEGGHDGGLLDP